MLIRMSLGLSAIRCNEYAAFFLCVIFGCSGGRSRFVLVVKVPSLTSLSPVENLVTWRLSSLDRAFRPCALVSFPPPSTVHRTPTTDMYSGSSAFQVLLKDLSPMACSSSRGENCTVQYPSFELLRRIRIRSNFSFALVSLSIDNTVVQYCISVPMVHGKQWLSRRQ